jgi:hypothetical protein
MTGTQSDKAALVSCVPRGIGRATALALVAHLGIQRRRIGLSRWNSL